MGCLALCARNLLDEEEINTGTFATQTVRRRVTGYGGMWPIRPRLLGASASCRF